MEGLDRLRAEKEAIQSLADLIDGAEECRALYERADMALPEPLKRFLGLVTTSNGHGGEPAQVVIPAPPRPRQPQEARPDWISINAKSASPQSVVMAILREASSPMRPRQLVDKVQEILPDVPSGSVANIGTKFHGTGIQRSQEGWTLRSPDQAGILFDGRLWGPPSIFGVQELAAHRREGILHLLSLAHVGLQTAQIEEQLRRCSWLKAPVNKDLLKADINYLARERKVRRRGRGKWELVPENEER